MTARRYAVLKIVMLLGLGIYLLYKTFSGTLYFYISDRFTWLVLFGGAGFVLLGLAALRNLLRQAAPGHSHASNWTVLIVAVPLLFGFLVPDRPLDSSALDTRGLTTNTGLGGGAWSNVELSLPSDQRSVLDWVRTFNFASDPSIYTGEPADVIGFVYHDDRLGADEFMVGRFAVTCCVADAFAVGVIVRTPQAADWPSNAWVHISGQVAVGQFDGRPYPVIEAASIKEVPVPPQPYLFP
ncbi:MAG: TIGR03943 family protein [Anaerolineales bacterium]|nr:TIGR03943 family protein [Anaerolineales bacterium]MCW5855709.1 TIGR03943 family protein [Anaerolineales bacterium]